MMRGTSTSTDAIPILSPISSQTNTHWLVLFLLCVMVLGSLLRLYDLDGKSFWSDELISLCHAKAIHDLESFLTPHCGNAHPPLYFLMLKAWSTIGETEFRLRLFSVIFGTAAIFAAFLLGRELAGAVPGLLVATLVAFSPFHLQYDREVRMYSLLTFLAMLSLYFFVRALRTGRRGNWVSYTALTALGIYVHYHMILVLLIEWLFFFLRFTHYRQRTRAAVLSQVVIAAIGMWWLPGFVFQIRHPDLFALDAADKLPVAAFSWVVKPLYIFYSFSLGQTILPWNPIAIVGGLLIAVLVVLGVKRLKHDPEALLLVGLGLSAPLVVAFLISQTMPRYFTLVAPLFYLVVAQGILFSPRAWIQGVVMALLLIPITVSANNYYQGREFHILAQIDPWREVSDHIRARARPMDCVVAIGSTMPLRYYLNEFEGFAEPMYSVNFTESKTCMDEDRNRRIWLVTSDSNLSRVSKGAREWFDEHYQRLGDREFLRDPDYEMKAKLFKKDFLPYRVTVSLYGSK